MKLYFIPCRFQFAEGQPKINGFAVCSSPDYVVTFLMPNSEAVTQKNMWTYDLMHYRPWLCLDN